MNDVVDKLTATLQTSLPQELTHAPADYVDLVDHPPAALFHRILTRDPRAFTRALTEALAHHTAYWGSSPAPRARIALGPLALACLAHDHGFPVPEDHRLLPTNLLNGRRIEAIP